MQAESEKRVPINSWSWDEVLSNTGTGQEAEVNYEYGSVRAFGRAVAYQVLGRIAELGGVHTPELMQDSRNLFSALAQRPPAEFPLAPPGDCTFSLADVQLMIKRFKVVRFFDVRDPEPLATIQALINFAFRGEYQLKEDPQKGRTLVTLQSRRAGESLSYGGLVYTQDQKDSEFKRLESEYILNVNSGLFPALDGWIVDGERYFCLGDLGRWVNTATHGENNLGQVNVAYDMRNHESLQYLLEHVNDAYNEPRDGFGFNVVFTTAVVAGSELLVRYAATDAELQLWEQKFAQPQPEGNAVLELEPGSPNFGLCKALTLIYAGEPIQLASTLPLPATRPEPDLNLLYVPKLDLMRAATAGYSVHDFVHVLFNPFQESVKKSAKSQPRRYDWDRIISYVHIPEDEPTLLAEFQAFVRSLGRLFRGPKEKSKWYNHAKKDSISLTELRSFIGDFQVTHHADTKLAYPRSLMKELINFAVAGQFELRETVPGGYSYGLFTKKRLIQDEFVTYYSGRWQSQNVDKEGTPLRLQSSYLLAPDRKFFQPPYTELQFLYWGWVVDAQRFFRLNELGRWINHPGPNQQRNVNWDLERENRDGQVYSLEEFIESDMLFTIVADQPVIEPDMELLIDYGELGPHQAFPLYEQDANVDADLYARFTIFPGEYIRSEVPEKEDVVSAGEKRKFMAAKVGQ